MSPSKHSRRRSSNWPIAAAILISGLMISASIFATRGSTNAAQPANEFAAPIVAAPTVAAPTVDTHGNLQLSVPCGCTPERLQEVLERWEEMWEPEMLDDESDDTQDYRVHGGVI